MRRGGSRLLRIGISYHFPGLMADDSCQQLGALVPERAVCGGGKPLIRAVRHCLSMEG